MPYAAWPATLPDADAPLKTTKVLPLITGDAKALGPVITERIRTRPCIKARSSILMEGTNFQDFVAFWRDTLFRGKKIFTADWLAAAGYEGYVLKMPTYSVGSEGVQPSIEFDLDLIPDVRLDVTQTFPEVWPPL